MYHLDAVMTQWLNGWSGVIPALDFLMVWSSAIGIPLMVLLTAGQWWPKHNREHSRHVLVATGLSFLLGLAINQIVLLFVQRMRPYDAGLTHLLIAPSADFSFPSDHATASFAIVAGFLMHGFRRRGLGLLAMALVIAVSRVYVGTHYVSDVMGGALTGVLAAILVRLFYREGSRLDCLLTNIL